MKDPRHIDEQIFEPIRHPRMHGAQVRKLVRKLVPKCNGKNSYKSEDHANHVRTVRQAGLPYPLYVYECPYYTNVTIRHWHLTHAPRRRRR